MLVVSLIDVDDLVQSQEHQFNIENFNIFQDTEIPSPGGQSLPSLLGLVDPVDQSSTEPPYGGQPLGCSILDLNDENLFKPKFQALVNTSSLLFNLNKKDKEDMIEQTRKYYHRQYYLKNKEKILDKKRKFRLENKKNILDKEHKYRLENKEKILDKKSQYNRRFYLKNKEKIIKKNTQYRLKQKLIKQSHSEVSINKIVDRLETDQYSSQNTNDNILQRSYIEKKEELINLLEDLTKTNPDNFIDLYLNKLNDLTTLLEDLNKTHLENSKT